MRPERPYSITTVTTTKEKPMSKKNLETIVDCAFAIAIGVALAFVIAYNI